MIPFNKPCLTGREAFYIEDVMQMGKLSGNGKYTQQCQKLLQEKYGFGKCFLTTSCTDALEMAAILADIQPGDEVIIPAYTFVSTANAFVLRGAKIVFADSRSDRPGMDETKIEKLITRKTKVIVPVHYGGVCCDMDKIMEIAAQYGLLVVEDAAQAIDAFYTGKDGLRKAAGSIGHLAAFSFHETKNITCGEGGMLVVNDQNLEKRAEIILENGTDRAAYTRGEIPAYSWRDIGSSFFPSEITAAFLFAQLENTANIQQRRIRHWEQYNEGLKTWASENGIQLPFTPAFAGNNAHMFYLVCKDAEQRAAILQKLKDEGITAATHYHNLAKSSFYRESDLSRELPFTDLYAGCLLRLPLFYDLEKEQIDHIIRTITGSLYV